MNQTAGPAGGPAVITEGLIWRHVTRTSQAPRAPDPSRPRTGVVRHRIAMLLFLLRLGLSYI